MSPHVPQHERIDNPSTETNGSFEMALANLRTRQKGRPSTVTVHRRIATMNNKTMGLDQTEEDLLISGISDETFIRAAF
jgi:hypothetical protein